MTYRIRMRFLQWYVDIFDTKDHCVERRGPFVTQAEADTEAENTGYRDADKG